MEQTEINGITQVKKEGSVIYVVKNNSSGSSSTGDYVTKEELANYATKSELTEYATNHVAKTGSRGELAGNETVSVLSGSQTIDINSPDTIVINTSGPTTLTFTPADINTTAIYVIALKNGSTTSSVNIVNAVWANSGETPVWGSANSNLILVATFIAGRVVLNVFDNDEQN